MDFRVPGGRFMVSNDAAGDRLRQARPSIGHVCTSWVGSFVVVVGGGQADSPQPADELVAERFGVQPDALGARSTRVGQRGSRTNPVLSAAQAQITAKARGGGRAG
jgi:hypothetical protein